MNQSVDSGTTQLDIDVSSSSSISVQSDVQTSTAGDNQSRHLIQSDDPIINALPGRTGSAVYILTPQVLQIIYYTISAMGISLNIFVVTIIGR